MKQGERKAYSVVLKNHNLAKGNYLVSYALGKGNYAEGIKAYDVVDKYSIFTITKYNTKQGFSTWAPGWGNLLFQSEAHEVSKE